MNKLLIVLGLVESEVISNVPCDGRDGRNRFPPEYNGNTFGIFPLRTYSDRTNILSFLGLAEGTFWRVKAALYWVYKVDLPFRGFETNACKSMNFPTRAGKRWSYNTTFRLGRNLLAVSLFLLQ